jgi:hypothetical protein
MANHDELLDALTGDLDIAHTLAPVRALNKNGESVRLGTLWEDKPVALIFLRQFG